MADFRNYQDQMYATSKSSHSQSTPGSLEQANALEAMCDALFGLVGELRDQVGALTARVDELEPRIGAGEEVIRRADLEAAGMTEDTIDWAALEEDQVERDNRFTDED